MLTISEPSLPPVDQSTNALDARPAGTHRDTLAAAMRHRVAMTLKTRFTEAYGLSTPIAQAGMAFVGMTPPLATAVSRAGALGALGAAVLPVPALIQSITTIK